VGSRGPRPTQTARQSRELSLKLQWANTPVNRRRAQRRGSVSRRGHRSVRGQGRDGRAVKRDAPPVHSSGRGRTSVATWPSQETSPELFGPLIPAKVGSCQPARCNQRSDDSPGFFMRSPRKPVALSSSHSSCTTRASFRHMHETMRLEEDENILDSDPQTPDCHGGCPGRSVTSRRRRATPSQWTSDRSSH